MTPEDDGSLLPTPEQEALRAQVRGELGRSFPPERVRALSRTVDGIDAESWRRVLEIAALADGGDAVERCLLLEETGRVLLPGPFLSSAVLARALLETAAAEEAAAVLLSRLGDGSRRAALVAPGWFGPVPRDAAVRAVHDGSSWSLSGEGGPALDAQGADDVILVARTEEGAAGVFVAAPDANGIEIADVPVIDATRRMAHVRVDSAPATRIDAGAGTDDAIARALDHCRIALAAEMVGSAQRCVELTLDWVRERRQFGVPIGSFQAIKHRCADVAIAVDAARDLVYLGADVIDSGRTSHLPAVASAAKLAAGEALLQAGAAAIQLHGGRGFTTEFAPELYYKRAVLTGGMLGSAAEHRDRLASALGV